MNIFIGALDWGMGHTTRIIPVIHNLCKEGHSITIGAGKNQVNIYKEHFPNLPIEKLPSASPVYFGRKNQLFSLLIFIPRFLISICTEHIYAKRIVEKYHIERIISDNRYGLYTRSTFNIIITHQLSLILPFRIVCAKKLVDHFLTRFLNHFNECHIPDYPGPVNLSGKLNAPVNQLSCDIKYIGPLSRLSVVNEVEKETYPEILVLISGPEKQRTRFEKQITKTLKDSNLKSTYLIVRGLPNMIENTLPNSVNHLPAKELKAYIKHAKYIICRSGYSTIMDLVIMGKTAMLVPTPGQTEQEYLAEHLECHHWFLRTRQDNIVIQQIIGSLDIFVPARLPGNFSKQPGK